jgi:L-alanine-DL-glutamate epimerase-like enolase superfamily enzyme
VADTPEKTGENILALRELPEGFTIVKGGGPFHGRGFFKSIGLDEPAYNTYPQVPEASNMLDNGSLLTEEALDAYIDHLTRIKSVVKNRVGLAFDCGPGMTAVDALKLARALEPLKLLWLEDTIAGDYTPYTLAHVYRDITINTTTPIHTGEQIYLRQNFRELIENRAVNVIGPDPADVGSIAELKWIAEYADLHGILMAPHGTVRLDE